MNNTYDIFIEAVELRSFSAAAKKLHLSPSTVSKQITLLEQKLGVQLFNRTTRSLSTSQAGELYYKRCKDISQRMDDAASELKDLSSETSGKLTITWPNVLSNSEIAGVLGKFCQEHPDIKLNIRVSTELLNLTEERIDFAFRVSKLTDSRMVAIELFSIQPLIVATPELVARYDTPTSIKELMSLPHILPTYINLAQKLRAAFPEINLLDKERYHEADEISALYNLAKEGVGAAFLFKHVVEKDIEEGRLIDLTKKQPLPKMPIYLVYPKLNFMPKKNRLLIDFLKSNFRQL